MGVAGPLQIKGQGTRDKGQEYYVPLATTEGALVASVNRGCKAITESGGATVACLRAGATRGPVFVTRGITESLALKTWMNDHRENLGRAAEAISAHLRLLKYRTRIAGKHVFVRFSFDTRDAMGMNMATIATASMVRIIEAETGARCVSVAGNYDTDKKPSWLNQIEGRGWKAWAEVTVPAHVLRNVLKTTARKIHDVWIAKCMIGSAMAGSIGFNAHYANVLAALFIATGQDPAHVAECSAGITTCEVITTHNSRPTTHNEDSGLYISVYLPDLMVGTVGGGTGLATQKEALSVMGVAGGNNGKNAQKLAEITGATVLAGEISLLASLAEGSLARAHQTLTRGQRNPTNKQISKSDK
jgi:hydroxymethylglutaryl-CoA reductase (NADPH)